MERLEQELRAARDRGEPFHAVHFDGHGVIDETGRGFIGFANFGQPGVKIDGTHLGKTLARYDVSFLILNACRSAWPMPLNTPNTTDEVKAQASYSSFAEEALAQGLAGVVGVSYAIFPRTAMLFFAELYVSLAASATLAEAAGRARHVLWSAADSEFADWLVPVVYETAPIRLKSAAAHEEVIPQNTAIGLIEPLLNRDAMVAQIEQAFETTSIVLLHGEAGIGKTTTARDFASWYERTGGCGTSLFTSFENLPSLENLTAQLQFLKDFSTESRAPSLWIWDNCENIGRKDEAYRPALRIWLLEFLISAGNIRVLITSRRNEEDWLQGLSVERLVLPRLNLRESWTLARAIGQPRLSDEALRPIVNFSVGNPLTLRMLATSALQTNAFSADKTSALVASLQLGESMFSVENDAALQTMAAFELVFQSVLPPESRNLAAVTHLFGQTVHPGIFAWMTHNGNEEAILSNPAMSENDRSSILVQLSDFGILHPVGELYRIHPLGQAFVQHCWRELSPENRAKAEAAFVDAAATHSQWLLDEKDGGKLTSSFDAAPYEEYLRNALRLGLRSDLYEAVAVLARVLGPILGSQNRTQEHWDLYEEIRPLFMDVTTLNPRPGREYGWNLIMSALAGAAHQQRDYANARNLYERHLGILRERWSEAQKSADPGERRLAGNNLIAILKSYAYLLRELTDQKSVALLEEAFQLATSLEWIRLQADLAYDLAEVFRETENARNLDVAEMWIGIALRLRAERHGDARSDAYLSRGRILLEKYLGLPAADRLTPASLALLANSREAFHNAHRDASAENAGLLMTIEFNLACAHAAGQDEGESSRWFTSALRRAAMTGDERTIATIYAMRAHVAEEDGRHTEAQAYARKAYALMKDQEPLPFNEKICAMLETLANSGRADSSL